ncbi:MAG: AAA family ATPase [Methanothermobacter sp.]|nr:AAA family ATPase [Methanothermobacter sp.]
MAMSNTIFGREDLKKIKGIGDKLADKILGELGGEEELTRLVENREVDRLARVDGISQRKAIEVINSLLGDPIPQFLKGEGARRLYEDIINRILPYANTQYSRNRILLLHPRKDPKWIKEHIQMVMDSKETIQRLPIEKIRRLLKNIKTPDEPKPKFNQGVAILTEDEEEYERLIEMGLNRYHPILINPNPIELREYELIIYVYSEGLFEVEGAHNIIMVHAGAEKHQIVPETILDYFKENRKLLRSLLALRRLLGWETVLDEVMNILGELEESETTQDINKIVNTIKSEADEKLEKLIKRIDLKGDEILRLLDEGTTNKIDRIFEKVMREAKEKLKEETGIDFNPYIKSYPLKIDEKELKRAEEMKFSEEIIKTFEKRVEAAEKLSKLKPQLEEEIKEILEFDYKLALGCFAAKYKLEKPQITDKIKLKGALHLNLIPKEDKENIQRIDYQLDNQENISLLTGANSGGKTTLIETIAQIIILAQMGLPVPVKEAQIKIFDEIHLHSKEKTLDAGEFESFLRRFTNTIISKKQKLILLDEIEAITELEAAVKILSTFIELIKNSESYAVIVTHMAREITEEVNVRIDGIEAKGLDENYNLIVNRTPKMNYLAKSTPELIVEMLHQKSNGKTKKIYAKILEKFKK